MGWIFQLIGRRCFTLLPYLTPLNTCYYKDFNLKLQRIGLRFWFKYACFF